MTISSSTYLHAMQNFIYRFQFANYTYFDVKKTITSESSPKQLSKIIEIKFD
jgi:hypothetical protein